MDEKIKTKDDLYWKALSAAQDMLGDMGLPEQSYAPVIAGYERGYQDAEPKWIKCSERLPVSNIYVGLKTRSDDFGAWEDGFNAGFRAALEYVTD